MLNFSFIVLGIIQYNWNNNSKIIFLKKNTLLTVLTKIKLQKNNVSLSRKSHDFPIYSLMLI